MEKEVEQDLKNLTKIAYILVKVNLFDLNHRESKQMFPWNQNLMGKHCTLQIQGYSLEQKLIRSLIGNNWRVI